MRILAIIFNLKSFQIFLRIGIASVLLLAANVGVAQQDVEQEAQTSAETQPQSDSGKNRFFADDGDLDVSGFLDEAYGFLPVAMPITEPAVGYGLAGGVAFISAALADAKAGFGRPNITMVGGLRTENGTKGGVVADFRYWNDDRLQTVFAVIDSSVNLDFYGFGDNNILSQHPLRYNLEPQLGIAQMKYRLGQSASWLGLGYAYANIDVSFEAPPITQGIPDFEKNTVIGGILPSFNYDTRDSIFTPISGNYFEVSGGWFGPSLGGDEEFQRARVIGMHFSRLAPQWFLGVRFDAMGTYGDPPFYLKPYLSLRGAPAMRYQGDQLAQVEAELRWQFTDRFSAVAFAGTGKTWLDEASAATDDEKSIVTGGVGFRYEIARRYGIHMGLDVAVSEDDTAIYVQMGSAWARP